MCFWYYKYIYIPNRGGVTLNDLEDYLRQQDAIQREMIFTEIGLNIASAIGANYDQNKTYPYDPEKDDWKVELPNNGKNKGILGYGNVGDFSNLKGASINDILSIISDNAKKRILAPQPGKVMEDFEYTWKNLYGTKMTVRVHGPYASAPAGSNAANVWIVRVQQGKKYFDPVSGEFQPPGISRPNSQFYNEEIINNTHIPIQTPKQ